MVEAGNVMKYLLALSCCLLGLSCQVTSPHPLKNFHQVDGHLCRSAQPTATNVSALEQQGITEVLSLRRFHDDADLPLGKGIVAHHLPMRAGNLDRDDLLAAMRVIDQAQGKILVHCWHGSDRTGAVVACYRMVRQGWTADRAIAELRRQEFGYHAMIYPEIETLLRSLDVNAMRRALGSSR